MRAAAFAARQTTIVEPLTLRLHEGERQAVCFAQARSAALAALLAAGIVNPTSGRVFIAAFDPAIQPVQAKRIAGYVPHEALAPEFTSFTRYVEYRAALWGLPRAQTVVRARALLERLEGVHEAFAYPLVGALLAQPLLLVLDRPQAAFASSIACAAADCAIFSTHVSQQETDAFAGPLQAVT